MPLSVRPNGQVLAGFGHWELIKVQRFCPALIHQREQPTPLQGRTPGFSFWFAFPALQNRGSLVTESQFGSAQLVLFSINPSNSLSDLGHVTSLPGSQLISWKEGCVTCRAVSAELNAGYFNPFLGLATGLGAEPPALGLLASFFARTNLEHVRFTFTLRAFKTTHSGLMMQE